MPSLQYRARIFKSSATDTSSSGVDFTIGQNELSGAWQPSVQQPVIRPLEGRAESQTWDIDVLDVGSTFTSRLSDSSGRMVLLRRLVQLQQNTNGAGWSNLGVGRISDITLNDDVATYRIRVGDESYLTRGTQIFTTNTTRLYPGGPHSQYGPFLAPEKAVGLNIWKYHTKVQGIALDNFHNQLAGAGLGAIQNDVLPHAKLWTLPSSSVGNFKHLRLRVGATDYVVFAITNGIIDPQTPVDGLDKHVDGNEPLVMLVFATTSQLGFGSVYSSCFVHMFGAPPSEATPLHIGSSTGVGLGTLIDAVYSGTYSSSGAKMPRYSTAAIDTINAGGYPSVRYRITDTQDMHDWLADHVYAPFGLVPFIDSSGVLTPQSVFLPKSTSAITFTFNAGNMASHPTWDHYSRDQVTVLRCKYTQEIGRGIESFTMYGGNNPPGSELSLFGRPLIKIPGVGGDRLVALEQTLEYVHDRTTNFGRHERTYNLDGLHTNDQGSWNMWWPVPNLHNADNGALHAWGQNLSGEIFDRFGDGPIRGALSGLSTATSVQSGDYVKISLGTFPQPSTQNRSTTPRVVQILSREDTAAGPNFTYLDAGRFQQLGAPGATLSTSTDDARHELKLTVSGITTGSQWTPQVAIGATQPTSGSGAWQPCLPTLSSVARVPTLDSSGTYLLRQRPSNTKHWVRVREHAPRRIGSAWTLTTGKVTGAITAPSALSISTVGVTKGVATRTVSWTNGSTVYWTDLHIDDDSTGFTADNMLDSLAPGSNRYQIEGIKKGAAVNNYVGVRHKDPYGGYSAFDTTSFLNLSSGLACPSMFGLTITDGRSTD